MNADRLLALYERVAEAPDAIARMRRFVLDLAVRGKLAAQDMGDEPAASALERLKANGTLNGAFPLPRTWTWIDVDAVAESRLGKMLDKAKNKGSPHPYLRNINVRWFDFDLADLLEMPFEESELAEFSLKRGDVLICEGGEPGRAAVWDERADGVYFQKAIHRVRFAKPVDPDFFLLCLKTSAEDGRLAEYFTGTGIKHFTGKGLRSYRFPLPPLAEQRRIVAKVEELMALLDRLEAARTAREATRDRLTAASLARLTTSNADPADFPDNARFALVTLPALTTRPDQIKPLRQTILNLAVRGKLVNSSGGEVATVGKFRKLQNGYAFESGWFTKSGMRLLRNANIGHGEIRWGETVHLPQDRVEEFERFRLREGDIVLTLDRPFIVTGTKVARVTEADLPSLLLQRVGRFFKTADGLADDYLFLWINSPHFNDQIDPGRSNGVPHISSKQVEAAEIYVPPLAEQHRIVARVDALMALCHRLEAALTTADTTRARLLEALLHEALDPAAPAAVAAA